jgi:hypothetical protein
MFAIDAAGVSPDGVCGLTTIEHVESVVTRMIAVSLLKAALLCGQGFRT